MLSLLILVFSFTLPREQIFFLYGPFRCKTLLKIKPWKLRRFSTKEVVVEFDFKFETVEKEKNLRTLVPRRSEDEKYVLFSPF